MGNIPNLVTLGNLLSGCLSISAASQGLYSFAIVWIFLGLFLDFMDGFLARTFRVESPMGKELDSFSDLISFGLAPSYLIFQLTINEYGINSGFLGFLPYFSWVITLFTAVRLGRYNLGGDENKIGFWGLPSPANAVFICSIPLAKLYNPEIYRQFMDRPYLFFLFIVLSAALLISPIPLFHLKFSNLSWKENQSRILFLLALVLGIPALYFLIGIYIIVPFIIFTYFLFSILYSPLKNNS
jgi:CDP-diacylglycerol--serine O-phosphatidyltransferase